MLVAKDGVAYQNADFFANTKKITTAFWRGYLLLSNMKNYILVDPETATVVEEGKTEFQLNGLDLVRNRAIELKTAVTA
jgi:hypothetical protein